MDFSSLDMPLKNKKLLQCKYSHESVNKNPLNYIKSEDISRRSKNRRKKMWNNFWSGQNVVRVFLKSLCIHMHS